MDLHVSNRVVGDHVVVSLEGLADLGSLPILHDHLARAIERHGPRLVIVELDGVSMIDDAALGVVLGAAGRARDRGGDLEVVCAEPRLRARLATTRFDLAVVVRDAIV